MSNPTNPILYMANVMKALRTELWSKDFIEIPTPILRKHDASARFPRFKLEDGRYLREAPAFALRRNLEYFPRVFEIGPCFRKDELDDTHLQQFTMLDLYQKGTTLEDAINLCKALVSMSYKGPFKTLSVAKQLYFDFKIDLFNDPASGDKLKDRLMSKYNKKEFTFTQLINQYLEEEIEPKSKGCCLIVTEYPIASEILGKPKEGTACIAGNAEFKIEGIEVVNVYQDDPDTQRVLKQGKLFPDHHSADNELICNLVNNGTVPSDSAGFGIGIERLCRVSLGLATIQPFIVSPEFNAKQPKIEFNDYSKILEPYN